MPAQFARRGQVRFLAAVLILAAWGAGLTALVRREFFQGRPQRLAEAALRLSPGASYFAVSRNGAVVGFASTTVDTVANGIDAVDYLVTDLPSAGTVARTTRRSILKLSRGLSLRTFDTQVDSRDPPEHAGGRADGDSAIIFVRSTGTQPADSQRVRVSGPVVLPAMVPIVVALSDRLEVGRTYVLPTFDPVTMTSRAMKFTIRAESLFTLVDSARFDQSAGDWVGALTDTVRAWRLETADSANAPRAVSEWIDAQGRVVESLRRDGLSLHRTAYELAFENWRVARDRAKAARAGTDDVLERTAIAAGATPGRSTLRAMSVVLGAPSFRGYDIDGGRQHFSGDTLVVVREQASTVLADVPTYAELSTAAFRQRFRDELAAEPLLQVHDAEIVRLAVHIVGLERVPARMAQSLVLWLHDSLTKAVTSSVPSAIAIARARRGDANEHTQLFVALSRALGIPARFAAGLLYLNGKFYYHAWPEVWLGAWVAVDPTFGQFPADAGHLRFVVGGLARQTELLQLMGNLTIHVLEAK